MKITSFFRVSWLACTVLFTTACTTPFLGGYRYVEEQPRAINPTHHFGMDYPYQNGAPVYTPPGLQPDTTLARWVLEPPPLSPGDRLQIKVQNGVHIDGLYEIDIDGALNIPFIPSLKVAGLKAKAVQNLLKETLITTGTYHKDRVQVSVMVQQWAPVQINVTGAVFNPGMISTNVRPAEDRVQKSTQYSGDFPPERLLPAALRSAGGIRPDAAVNHIRLIRNGVTRVVDLSGVIKGYPVEPIALMAGDTIVVPTTNVFNSELVKPSAITTPGIRVFLSNLITPAPGNALASIEKHATSLPYGTRLLSASISANCIGGTNTTNGSRHVVLVRTDPITGKEESIKRPVHELLRHPEKNVVNPFVMPNDSIACYDSGITNLRDIARTLGDILLPITLLMVLM